MSAWRSSDLWLLHGVGDVPHLLRHGAGCGLLLVGPRATGRELAAIRGCSLPAVAVAPSVTAEVLRDYADRGFAEVLETADTIDHSLAVIQQTMHRAVARR